MKIAIIQATSQINKNKLIYSAVKKYASEPEIYNFGCTEEDTCSYSYIDISLLIGLLLASKSVDFVVTGCSSGQGMMLACNNMPGVICGYVPAPKDAYLFAQINNGNAISLPLGEDYTWNGADNLDQTIASVFSEPFGQGYPRSESERKLRDTETLKKIKSQSQISFLELLDKLDNELLQKMLSKKDVIGFVLANGTDCGIAKWLRGMHDDGNKNSN
jgi:ribose 5-phosphate isomerase RpiB